MLQKRLEEGRDRLQQFRLAGSLGSMKAKPLSDSRLVVLATKTAQLRRLLVESPTNVGALIRAFPNSWAFFSGSQQKDLGMD